MITAVRIENFKAFTDVALDISPLTLFTGKNGMGKSSFIQSLLLLRQSYLEDKSLSELTINGKLVSIGIGKDLLNIHAVDDIVRFGLQFNSEVFDLSYTAVASLDKLIADKTSDLTNIHLQALFTNHFQYLNAERIVPSRTYAASPSAVEISRSLGEKGQYTVHFLDKYKFEPLRNPSINHPNAKSMTLLDNVNAWLSEISSEVRVKPRYHPDLLISTLSFEFLEGTDTTPEFASLNTGFGLTYVLPVIVAILSAESGDLLIIENPESHLHPQGQATLGRLLAMGAAAGIQILVESHSDHLFNGMRVAIKEGILSENDFSVYFFSRESEYHSVNIDQPLVDSNGRLSYQPSGFFDEYGKQLGQIIQNG